MKQMVESYRNGPKMKYLKISVRTRIHGPSLYEKIDKNFRNSFHRRTSKKQKIM